MSPINGVIVPSITFFDEKFEINTELNSILFRHTILNGANAILLFETKEEGNFFSDKIEQKIKLIKLAYESTEGKIPIIVGVNANDINDITYQIEDLGKKYNKLNFIIAPPSSEKMTSNDLRSYFENLLGSLDPKNRIYFYNNPNQFAGNEIKPEILNDLIRFSNLKGIIDASDKINIYKANIQLLGENFGVYCSNVPKFSTFIQIIPLELRKYSGLVSSMGNLVNICAKLYNAALEDNILELLQLQDLLDDIRNKLYFKFEKGKKFLGLKYAFLYLYKDLLSIKIENFYKNLDETTKNMIEATINYLINQKRIYQLYSLKKELYQLDDIINLFSDIDVLKKQGKIRKIIGPFDGKINTIYKVNFENSQLIFRFRTSKSFQFENIVKEKVLFPLLDGILYPYTSKLEEKIKEIVNKERGAYIFSKENPPIIPVGNLIYYDETKEIVPYIFTIQNYIRGKTLHRLLEKYLSENLNINTPKFKNLFRNLGNFLGKLHEINFDSFYEKINDIGTKRKRKWLEIFNTELEAEIQEAKKNKIENIKEIENYFRDNISLIEEEVKPVLLHNDFQGKNFIVKDELGTIRINGLIDFDDWRIGPRALDFMKFNLLTLNPLGKKELKRAFYEGYSKYWGHIINKKFEKKIEIYSLLWFLKNYNFEIGKKRKTEQEKFVDIQPSLAKIYLYEIKKILML